VLFEQQISERQDRARSAVAEVVAKPPAWSYGDYQVRSTSGKLYRVAMRGPGLFENYCTCPDFAVNTLGTCKHIEALLSMLRKQHGRAFGRQTFERQRASVSLLYGDVLRVRLRLPAQPSEALLEVARTYFDEQGLLKPEHYRDFQQIMDRLRRADDTAVVYSDVLDFIDRENELAEGLEFERKALAGLKNGRSPLAGLLKVPLFPYQVRGALFAACRGRVVLADDMGLGKTIQAIAAVELLRRRRGVATVLVIAPASVKYQWKTEIEKFTALPVQVIDGPLAERRKRYAQPAVFNLSSYELVLKDLDEVRRLRPEVIILDEAQRIRNWATATARAVKQLKSRYAIVLTGTPLENKLEELYSVVEFVDGRRLGPAFRFLKEHRIEDDKGRLLGYRGLDQIHRQLEPILLRRTRREVLPELPKRTDQIFRVPMTKEQEYPYLEQYEILARLIHKWERQGWLSEIDLRRITCCLQNMRMLCNSTFLFDKQTNFSPKLKEFREIVRELAVEENRKVAVFSEYERMTYLAGEELKTLGLDFVSLHGGVPGRKRGPLLDRFRKDPVCKVLLSTDAGGVGLNLQVASAVVNFEPPWNPARLEQRIGRVHRMGQSQPVQVIHLLTENSIEERVWNTMKLKKALFAGLFEGTASEISFEKLGRKTMMQQIKEVFADQPPPRPEPPPKPAAEPQPKTGAAAPAPQPDLAAAAAGLLEAGLKFFESLTQRAPAHPPGVSPIERALSAVVRPDPQTNRPTLAIPLPDGFDAGRVVQSVQGLLNKLSSSLARTAGAGG
jgi:SNF2 family DNA or RNA helicase